MANSVKSAAGEWSLDEILADVRRMRGNAPSPSASDPVDQILAELHAQPAASTTKSRAQGHTHARHVAASTPARQASHASSSADTGAERHRQTAFSPRGEKADAQPSSAQQHKRLSPSRIYSRLPHAGEWPIRRFLPLPPSGASKRGQGRGAGTGPPHHAGGGHARHPRHPRAG